MWRRPSVQRWAEAGIGVLLLVVIRSLGEYFRLAYVYGDGATLARLSPYVAGALFAAVALIPAALFYAAGYYRTSIGIVIATVAGLLVFKLAVIG